MTRFRLKDLSGVPSKPPDSRLLLQRAHICSAKAQGTNYTEVELKCIEKIIVAALILTKIF